MNTLTAMGKTKAPVDEYLEKRADDLLLEHQQRIYRTTDQLLGSLLVMEWLAGMFAAVFISPYSWQGTIKEPHLNIIAAAVLGMAIVSLPLYLSRFYAGHTITRHVIAVGQMLFAALLIHLTGGRIETHFIVFGSLAFLSFYRDWRVLVSASIIVALDHYIRGMFWPQSVYGILTVSPWRWLEHSGWVLFEDFFLFQAIKQNLSEMKDIALRQAMLEDINGVVEEKVIQQTAELAKSEELFRGLCNTSPVGIFQSDTNGDCLFVSQRFEEISGFKLSEVKGSNWIKCIHPDDKKQISEDWNEFRRTGLRRSKEVRMVTPHGVVRWVHWLVSRTVDSQGTPSGFVGTVEDITERKHVEALTTHLASIVENSHDAIIGLNLTNQITSWNKGAEEIYKISNAKAISQDISMIVNPEDELELIHVIKLVQLGSASEQLELTLKDNDNALIDSAITISPLKNELGRITGTSLIARDITQRKEVERRISEFYSTVSHELRTPLTSIRGALGLISDGVVKQDTEEATELIRIAKTNSLRLVRLINDILDLRKIESGHIELHRSHFFAEELVQSTIEALQGYASQQGVHLVKQIEASFAIDADYDRTTQVLTNLISNAVKFSPRGGQVAIVLNKTDDGNARFSVIDHGKGISAKDHHKIFEKFQQIDSSDARLAEGTGLGLSISKAIVSQHGGSIDFKSVKGEGSTFWFELPLPNILPPTKGTKSDSDKQPSVLIVEDNEDIARCLTLLVENQGYNCLWATTKAQAIEILEHQAPNAILLDLGLPDGNGLDIIDTINGKVPPIIVITGQAANGDHYSTPAIYDWLTKPIDEKRLLSVLSRAAKQQETRTALIVDDDPDIRSVIKTLLQNLDLECYEAENGAEAIEHLRSHKPDLIVLDIVMPEMDGFACLEEMKNSLNIDIPLIVYTGKDLDQSERDRLASSVKKCLSKHGTSMAEFLEVVRELLNHALPVKMAD